jgi:hypothetical protein
LLGGVFGELDMYCYLGVDGKLEMEVRLV